MIDLVLCQITTLFGADYCSKVRLNSRLKAKTKVLLIKYCNGLFFGASLGCMGSLEFTTIVYF